MHKSVTLASKLRSSRINMEQFEMRELHRQLLAKNRLYLLHNLRPTETFWSTLYAKEVLSQDMIDEIKACRTMSSQVGQLLDVLPARGPAAFESFCEALLECDHSHVAEYLKTIEATDHFRLEVEPLTSEIMLDRLVSIFKKNTPAVQRFAERKFELILEEQERDLLQKEKENRELDTQCTIMTLEVSQLRNFLSSCTETSENLVHEIQRDFLSRSFLRDEKQHLEKLRLSLKDITGFEKMCLFYTNMQKLLSYLEKFSGVQGSEEHRKRNGPTLYPTTANVRSLHDKMSFILTMLVDIVDDLGTRTTIPGHVIREELEKVLRSLKEVMEDVWRIRDVFHSTIKQKRRLEGEVLSLLHNLQEIRRLEREVKEKQSHISDLNKQGAVMKKKTKHHRKQLEQIHLNVEQRRIQMSELQKNLERQLNSADQRLHAMLTLLPDLEDGDIIRSDTELTSDISLASRLNTPEQSRLGTGYRPKSGLVMPLSLDKDILSEKVQQETNDTKVKCNSSETANVNDKTKQTDSGSNNSVLLERRKVKQGLLPKEHTATCNTSPRKVTKDSRTLIKGEKGTLPKKGVQDKEISKPSETKVKSQKDELDIDSWVANEKTRTKSEELQQKLAKFQLKPAQDRTAEMENVRADIDDKINLIKARNRKSVPPSEKKPPDKYETGDQEYNSLSGNPSDHDMNISASGSRSSESRSGSNKENSTPDMAIGTAAFVTSNFQDLLPNSFGEKTEDPMSPTKDRRSYRQADGELRGTSVLNMDSSELPRQATKYIEPDTWIPPKKRYNEREALKANKIEIRLPSN